MISKPFLLFTTILSLIICHHMKFVNALELGGYSLMGGPDGPPYLCQPGSKFEPGSAYSNNLSRLLSYLLSKANESTSNGYFVTNTTALVKASTGSETIYGTFLCRGDTSRRTCNDCVAYCVAQVPSGECQNEKTVETWCTKCMVRYSNNTSFLETADKSLFTYLKNNENITNEVDKFNKLLERTLKSVAGEVILRANYQRGVAARTYFGVMNDVTFTVTVKLYTMAQCVPDLDPSTCRTCLNWIANKMFDVCYERRGCQMANPGCYTRYEIYPFDEEDAALHPLSQPSPSGSTNQAVATAGKRRDLQKAWIVVVLAPFLLLAALSFWFLHKRKRKTRKEVLRSDEIKCVDPLQFEYNIIEAATDNFSDAKRLGKEAPTKLYQGILPGGQEIVVKRMSKMGEDSELEFNNEVLVLANLQHRNLVRLLGFCIGKDVRLILYEYLPNESLSQILCDPAKRAQLDWETRHKIIQGIARGLLYLHEDSQLRVVHRDITTSNILLDAEMNPKISNFSKASRVHVDEPKGDTSKIKGKHGYMAPKYVLQGHFSIKSDIFSFGVLLLEIISGQTLSNFSGGENGECLLSFAWRTWSEGKALVLIDNTLQGTQTYMTEILKCIKIALLCVQEDPICRPTMSTVVFMLYGSIDNIANPSRPGFIIHGDMPLSISEHGGHSSQGSMNEASTSHLEPR